jgi:hypothetical protein
VLLVTVAYVSKPERDAASRKNLDHPLLRDSAVFPTGAKAGNNDPVPT